MPTYTYTASDSRVTEAKGDIGDEIMRLAPDVAIFGPSISASGVVDPHFQYLEDSLASVDLNNAHSEGSDAPEGSDTSRSLVDGYVQILMKTADVTDVQQSVAQYGMEDEFDYQRAKKLVELQRDMEGIGLSSQAGQPGTNANDNIWLTSGPGSFITSHTNTTFNESNFNDMVENIVADGGSPNTVLCDSTRKSAISEWDTQVTRFSSELKQLEDEVAYYHGAIGPNLAIRHHPLMNVASGAPNLLMLDLQYWERRNLMTTVFKDLPDQGGGPRGTWKQVWGLGCEAEKANGQFYNVDA